VKPFAEETALILRPPSKRICDMENKATKGFEDSRGQGVKGSSNRKPETNCGLCVLSEAGGLKNE